MSYAADLHVHSPFARGTSRRLTFDGLAHWARVKGIDLLATGDFTHPQWIEETRDRLADAGNGLFTLGGVHFVLGTELSCVASQGGRSRRVHVLALAPSLETVERINSALAAHGNLASDGRPVLRLTPRDLLETLLEIDDRCILIPAHLWTPWYGLYGSKSGFDSLEESFGDIADRIPAVETGLSSDPAMNWGVPSLDDVSIVSFSDAHSPAKLGRELTVVRRRPELRQPGARAEDRRHRATPSSSFPRRASTTTPATESAACGTLLSRSPRRASAVRSAAGR